MLECRGCLCLFIVIGDEQIGNFVKICQVFYTVESRVIRSLDLLVVESHQLIMLVLFERLQFIRAEFRRIVCTSIVRRQLPLLHYTFPFVPH